MSHRRCALSCWRKAHLESDADASMKSNWVFTSRKGSYSTSFYSCSRRAESTASTHCGRISNALASPSLVRCACAPVSVLIPPQMLYVSLEPSGVRIALGAGLEPLDLLEPGDTLTLRVCRLPDHARESDIINACGGTRAGVLSVKLRACDNTDENSDLQSSGTAYVNFASVQQAADTMAGFGGDSVRVCGSSCPVAFSLFFYGVSAIKAEGVITWFAAAKLPPPMATITFASAQALRNAIQTPLIVNGQSVVLSYPRIAKPEKHNAQAKNLPLSVDEVTLEEVCQQRY